MGEGAGGAGRKTPKKKKKKLKIDEDYKKPRKGAEPGLNITPAEHRRYIQDTLRW